MAQQRDEIVLVATGDEIGQIGLICRAILHAPAKEALLARACPAEVARRASGGSEPTQAEFFNLPRRRTTGALRAACLSLSTAHAMHSGYLLQPFFFSVRSFRVNLADNTSI